MLRFTAILVLFGLCVLTQTQAYHIYARSAQENVEEEDPEPQGRLFSIGLSAPATKFDSKPIIITQPSALPTYPQFPFYPNYPQQSPVIHPVPYPVPHYPHGPHRPTTIIKPIVYWPYSHGHDHHHHHCRPGRYGHHCEYSDFGYGGGGFSNIFPPFINITYSPAAVRGGTTVTEGEV